MKLSNCILIIKSCGEVVIYPNQKEENKKYDWLNRIISYLIVWEIWLFKQCYEKEYVYNLW